MSTTPVKSRASSPINLQFNNTYAQSLPEISAPIEPAQFPLAKWLITSSDVDELLHNQKINSSSLISAQALKWFAGIEAHTDAQPIAQKYTGHQFGQYNPQLGDGRGVLLGEIESDKGRFDLHVKGAGQTPFSRFGDGRAVVRSSIREFLGSEALHYLGIPTSRALGVFTTGESVQREIVEPGAALIRVCPSHLRFGHFEYAYHQGDTDLQEQLVKYCLYKVLPQHHSDLAPLQEWKTSDTPVSLAQEAQLMFRFIIRRTAEMVAKWQAFGFCHGVMNTDNMSVLGITFDYGPFGFLDKYDPKHICNHSDHSGRYAFDEQPGVALWNLNVLGHALSNVMPEAAIREELEKYESLLLTTYSELMRAKLGLTKHKTEDRALLGELLAIMQVNQADYTIVWRTLSEITDFEQHHQRFINLFLNREQAATWLKKYRARLNFEPQNQAERSAAMCQVNPKYILRNYLAQQAIEESEKGQVDKLNELYQVLKSPFAEQPEFTAYAKHPPSWADDLNISCSS